MLALSCRVCGRPVRGRRRCWILGHGGGSSACPLLSTAPGCSSSLRQAHELERFPRKDAEAQRGEITGPSLQCGRDPGALPGWLRAPRSFEPKTHGVRGHCSRVVVAIETLPSTQPHPARREQPRPRGCAWLADCSWRLISNNKGRPSVRPSCFSAAGRRHRPARLQGCPRSPPASSALLGDA